MGRAAWARVLWRFTLAALLLGTVAALAGDRLTQAALPLYRLTLEWIDPDHRVDSLQIVQRGPNRVLALRVSRTHWVVVGGKALEPHPQAQASASTLAMTPWPTLVLMLSALAAWPIPLANPIRQGLLRAAAGALACGVYLALDAPFTLDAAIWGLYREALEPGAWSGLLAWSEFLAGGGRYGLGLGLAGLACGVSAWRAPRCSASATATTIRAAG